MKHAYILAAPIALACSPAMAQNVSAPFGSTLVEQGSLPALQTTYRTPLFPYFEFDPGLYQATVIFSGPDAFARMATFTSTEIFSYIGPDGPDTAQDDYTDLVFPVQTRGLRYTYGFEIREGIRDEPRTSEIYLDFIGFQLVNNNSQSVGYSIYFGAVPEPGTWALLILGFGAIGYAMRSQRKVQVHYV